MHVALFSRQQAPLPTPSSLQGASTIQPALLKRLVLNSTCFAGSFDRFPAAGLRPVTCEKENHVNTRLAWLLFNCCTSGSVLWRARCLQCSSRAALPVNTRACTPILFPVSTLSALHFDPLLIRLCARDADNLDSRRCTDMATILSLQENDNGGAVAADGDGNIPLNTV